MTFCDNLLKSFSENFIQLTKWMIFYYFCVFMKTVGFCPVFIADMNSTCKNTLASVNLLIWANFIKGYSLTIQPIFSKIGKFLILLYLSSFPSKNNILWHFVTMCSRVLVKISNNYQKWMIFYYFCVFMKTVGFCPVLSQIWILHAKIPK